MASPLRTLDVAFVGEVEVEGGDVGAGEQDALKTNSKNKRLRKRILDMSTSV